MSGQSTSSLFQQTLFESALRDYEKQTGIPFNSDPYHFLSDENAPRHLLALLSSLSSLPPRHTQHTKPRVTMTADAQANACITKGGKEPSRRARRGHHAPFPGPMHRSGRPAW